MSKYFKKQNLILNSRAKSFYKMVKISYLNLYANSAFANYYLIKNRDQQLIQYKYKQGLNWSWIYAPKISMAEP